MQQKADDEDVPQGVVSQQIDHRYGIVVLLSLVLFVLLLYVLDLLESDPMLGTIAVSLGYPL